MAACATHAYAEMFHMNHDFAARRAECGRLGGSAIVRARNALSCSGHAGRHQWRCSAVAGRLLAGLTAEAVRYIIHAVVRAVPVRGRTRPGSGDSRPRPWVISPSCTHLVWSAVSYPCGLWVRKMVSPGLTTWD